MLSVLCVVDKEGTALDRLAQGVAPYHQNIDYKVVSVHPKRPDNEQLRRFIALATMADVIDWQYCRNAEKLRQEFAEILVGKKHILTHNNPYSIHEGNWNDYDLVIGNNKEIYENLGKITTAPVEYVPITVDATFWEFNREWKPFSSDNDTRPTVIMVANRIESKKGILPLAIACGDAGFKMILVGAISDINYFNDVIATGVVHYHEKVTDEELRELYYKSTIHVCNSVDNFESGTMPVLEAMFCGVPVLSRKVGHVPDIYNGENMVINEHDSEDVVHITNLLKEMIMDKDKLHDMREKAFQSVKLRNFERRAYMYQKLYREVMFKDTDQTIPVSVIVPVYDNPQNIRKCLEAISEQTYKNLELIVVNDNPNPNENIELVKTFSQYVDFPIRFIDTSEGRSDYGLARARNIGTIEATGDVVVYCDQRMIMHPNAIQEFIKYLKPKYWLFGNKNGKKSFVENFSCAYRKDVINAGMFSERMNLYGGMSQELRYRIRNQGIQTEFVENAKADPVGKSSNKNSKRQEIIKMKTVLFKMGLDE